jgi:hypothetical protein
MQSLAPVALVACDAQVNARQVRHDLRLLLTV